MAVYLSLDSVSQAIYAVLNVAAMTALVPGGITDDVGQKLGYPFLHYVVSDNARGTGLGTKPGQGQSLEVDIRLHVFSKGAGFLEAQGAMSKAIQLLSVTDAMRSSLAANGYTLCGGEPFYDESIPISDSVVAGESVKELVANFRLYVEEAA